MNEQALSLSSPVTIIGLYWEFFSRNKYAFVTYIIFLCLMPVRDVLIPHLTGSIVTSIQKKKDLVKPIIYMFAATIFVHVTYNVIEYIEVDLVPEFYAFVRKKVIKMIFDVHENDYAEVETGKMIAYLLRLPRALHSLLNSWKYTFIPYIILSITAIVYFSYQNKTLGISLALVILFCWFMMYFSVKNCNIHAYDSENAINELTEYVDDVLKNMSTVLTSNYKNEEITAIRAYEDTNRVAQRDLLLCSLKHRYLTTPITVAYFIFFVWTCLKEMKKGKMDAGHFVALIIIIFRIFNAIWDMTGYMNDIIDRWGSLKKTIQVFSEFTKNLQDTKLQKDTFMQSHFLSPNVSPIPEKAGFQFKNVSFTYKTREGRLHKALDDFSLHVPDGQKLAVMGTIGSGKSTLLKILLKQYIPDKGEIMYQGIPYKDYTTTRIRNMIGYIPQHAILFNKTIYENITYGIPHISKEEVVSLIEKMQLGSMFARFEGGIDMKVGKYGSNLSGGQRQVVTILRVILKNPKIILMDEPTASIDERTKTVMYNLLQKLMQGRTVIVVSHDDFLLKYVDRVIYMENGKIKNERQITSSKNYYN